MSLTVLIDVAIFFYKQKTAYEMRISDWSSDVCSSDLRVMVPQFQCKAIREAARFRHLFGWQIAARHRHLDMLPGRMRRIGSECQLRLRIGCNGACRAAKHGLEFIKG